MRDGNTLAQQALSRQGRYQDVRDNLRVKEVRLDQQPGVRWIICHHPEQAAKDKTDRDRHLDAVRAELERITALRAKATPAKARVRPKGKDAASEPAAHVKAECALRDHKALGRWVRQTAVRAADPGHRQGRRGGTPGRQVPVVHLRPEPARRRGRPRLQEPAGGRTLVPGHEVGPRAAPGVPPARAAHPRPRAAVLAGAAAGASRRTTHRADLGHHQPSTRSGPRRHPHRDRRHRRAHHPTQHRPSRHC